MYWLFFVLKKINSQGRKGKVAFPNLFPILGIGFGVTVLIVVLSVMNGFQRGYIDTVLEVSSSHVRLEGALKDLKEIKEMNNYKSFIFFNEEQALLQGKNDRQNTAIIRALEKDIIEKDNGFKEKVKITKGNFSLYKKGDETPIILGSELARALSARVGDYIQVLATSGSFDSELFPESKNLLVTGIFKTEYYEIDSNFAFINLEDASDIFGFSNTSYANVKLEDGDKDILYISNIKEKNKNIKIQSWREYNRAFFGALKVEKNVMMLLIILIFLVVAVNIYNGMRRSIYEKKEEISILISMGAKKSNVKMIFILIGFLIGIFGSFFGLILGVLISLNINIIFSFIETIVNLTIQIISIFFNTLSEESFAIFNSSYFYMEKVPTKIFFSEIFLVVLFGIFSSTFAALIATRKMMNINLAEILRYE